MRYLLSILICLAACLARPPTLFASSAYFNAYHRIFLPLEPGEHLCDGDSHGALIALRGTTCVQHGALLDFWVEYNSLFEQHFPDDSMKWLCRPSTVQNTSVRSPSGFWLNCILPKERDITRIYYFAVISRRPQPAWQILGVEVQMRRQDYPKRRSEIESLLRGVQVLR
jgi:hypothetical protein